MLDTAATFQIPVATSTAKATQATWLNRRAASTATPPLRRIGTSAASTSWPPTQMVAASTCRYSRMVSQLTASILPSCQARGSPGPRGSGPGRVARLRCSFLLLLGSFLLLLGSFLLLLAGGFGPGA